MTDALKTIHDVDLACLANEAAKAALELAKQEAEATRLRLEDTLSKAEEAGLSRTKLRKVAEERASALLASGLLKEDGIFSEKPSAKVARAPRRPKAVETESTFNPESSLAGNQTSLEAEAASDVSL